MATSIAFLPVTEMMGLPPTEMLGLVWAQKAVNGQIYRYAADNTRCVDWRTYYDALVQASDNGLHMLASLIMQVPDEPLCHRASSRETVPPARSLASVLANVSLKEEAREMAYLAAVLLSAAQDYDHWLLVKEGLSRIQLRDGVAVQRAVDRSISTSRHLLDCVETAWRQLILRELAQDRAVMPPCEPTLCVS